MIVFPISEENRGRVKPHFPWITVVCLCRPELGGILSLALSVRGAPNKKDITVPRDQFIFFYLKGK